MGSITSEIDIFIVGTGMVGYRQLTREVEAAFRKSDRVYLIHGQSAVERYIEEDIGVEVINLVEEYTPGENRARTYDRMVQQVMEGAEQTDGTITLALYGHPMVYVSPAREVAQEAPDRGLRVEVLPGISSMDCLYADLLLDPASNGIQMYEATDLLLREFELNPDVPAMLWQIGTVETVLYNEAGSEPGRFTGIRNYLERFYPEDHTLYLLRTATYPIADSEQIGFELREFEAMHDRVEPVHTLYIPPVRERPIQNEELDELVRSKEHLERITTEDERTTDDKR